MRMREALRTALGQLAAHKLRSALTVLGIVFGVGAVIAMLSIGAGAEREALAAIERLGVRNLLVRTVELDRDELREVREKTLGLSQRDVQAILEAIPGVERVAPRVDIEAFSIYSLDGRSDAKAAGVSHHHRELADLRLAEGRFLDSLDEQRHAQVCVLGASARRELFGYGEAVGREVKVNDVWLTVIGVLEPDGVPGSSGGSGEGAAGREIYLPVTTAVAKFDRDPLKAPLDQVVVRLDAAADPVATGALLERLLDRLHAGAGDLELVVPYALLQESRRTQRLFTLIMGSIAGISLLVGGIGIMNIMLASVLERTREIGIRRAVGATRRDIQRQFLMEAFTLSVTGGAAGVVLGIGGSVVVGLTAGWETVVTPWAILLAAGVAVAVGLGSGFYPAVQAARLDPIEALRYE